MKTVSKKTLLLLILAVLLIGAWTVPIFPDPYYHEERVTFFVWCQREIDEMLHGEKVS